jgi:hypothetical protein
MDFSLHECIKLLDHPIEIEAFYEQGTTRGQQPDSKVDEA